MISFPALTNTTFTYENNNDGIGQIVGPLVQEKGNRDTIYKEVICSTYEA